jgi:pimeloyl-ACP methyl ester carboxylesterase
MSRHKLFADITLLLTGSILTAGGKDPGGFSERNVEVNGARIHYSIGGKGSPVVLLHGYAQTSHMWNHIIPLLASNHTVIVPDLRGAGGSSKPESGYDKKNMAVDIHEIVKSLGFNRAAIVGHDIGLMVAYAYAAQFPQETERKVIHSALKAITHPTLRSSDRLPSDGSQRAARQSLVPRHQPRPDVPRAVMAETCLLTSGLSRTMPTGRMRHGTGIEIIPLLYQCFANAPIRLDPHLLTSLEKTLFSSANRTLGRALKLLSRWSCVRIAPGAPFSLNK